MYKGKKPDKEVMELLLRNGPYFDAENSFLLEKEVTVGGKHPNKEQSIFYRANVLTSPVFLVTKASPEADGRRHTFVSCLRGCSLQRG